MALDKGDHVVKGTLVLGDAAALFFRSEVEHKTLEISRWTGGPTQARFWLEWGNSTAGQSLPAARSRLRAVHSDSISTRPSSPVT